MGLGGVPPVFADEERDAERELRRDRERHHLRAARTRNAPPEPHPGRPPGDCRTADGRFRAGFRPEVVRGLYVAHMAVPRKPARTAGAPPKRPTELEAAAARQRARERAGEDEHPRKSGPARGGKG